MPAPRHCTDARRRPAARLLFLAAGLLLAAASARSSPLTELPVGDPLEPELRAFEVLNGEALVPGIALRRLHTRPIQRVELRGHLSAPPESLPPAVGVTLARIGRELARDLPVDSLGLPSAGRTPRLWTWVGLENERFEGSAALEGAADFAEHEAPLIASGSGARLRMNAEIERWSAGVDMLFGRLDEARRFADPIVPGNDLVSHLVAARLAYTGRDGRWALGMGRSRHQWGPGDEGSLLISGSAPPVTGFDLRARLEGLGVDAIALNATLESAAGEQLAAHRIEWRPFPSVRLGLAEAARYKSPSWQALYLAGVIPYVLVQRIAVQEEPDSLMPNRNNVLVGLDAAVRVVPGIRVYGEMVIDDLHAKTADIPNKLGFQVGLEGYRSLGHGRVGALGEFTRISRYVYTSFYGRTFEVQGMSLGWPDGPDSRRLHVRVSWDPDEAWQMGLRAAQINRGEGTLSDPFVPGSGHQEIWTFAGIVERTRDVELTGRWWPRSGVDLAVSGGWRQILNEAHVAGAVREGAFGSVAVRLER
jgi:hypothetical protein